MAERFFIRHPDGRHYRVDQAGFNKLYKDDGFVKAGATRAEMMAADTRSLDDLTVPELDALAESRGVELPADAKKADKIDALSG